ncbi:MAG: hypothetical protein CL912_12680 [Deltaproteobacteria bacterium]|nr:hypothetical protein [Deltaproteobacteria bacterium]
MSNENIKTYRSNTLIMLSRQVNFQKHSQTALQAPSLNCRLPLGLFPSCQVEPVEKSRAPSCGTGNLRYSLPYDRRSCNGEWRKNTNIQTKGSG